MGKTSTKRSREFRNMTSVAADFDVDKPRESERKRIAEIRSMKKEERKTNPVLDDNCRKEARR